MTVQEVLTVLRSATAPSRDVDFHIAEVVSAGHWTGRAYWRPDDDAPSQFRHADTYTASLDAALALAEHMLPKARVALQWHPEHKIAEATVGDGATVEAATPALAVVTALFEALAVRT